MFSNTTIASSTTIPIANESELNVIILSDPPVEPRKINADINDIGIVTIIITVALQRPKKKRTTKITKRNANKTVSVSPLIVCLMLSAVSIITESSTSAGKFFLILGNSF